MTTHKERMLSTLRGEPIDRIEWMPRLELWYRAHQRAGTLPDKYRGWDLRSIYRDQGMGYPAKGGGKVFDTAIRGIETVTRRKGDEIRQETITPVGTVSTVHRHSAAMSAEGIGALEVEHMIKGPADYDVVAWLYEHTEYTPAYEEFSAYAMECGEDGIPQVNTPWSPPGELMRRLIGWNNCYYHLADYPQQMERLLQIMIDKYWEMHRIIADSPALIVQHGAHFHAQMTPPPIFRRFFVPHLTEVAEFYHQHGKLLQFHGDGDVNGLEEMILEIGYDIAECLVTAPMVTITLKRLREVWGNRITIWGGLPSILLCEPFTDEEFVAYMRDLFRTIAPCDAFVLGIADMAMPASKWSRIESVLPMVQEYGRYPIPS
jgi:hypothetical protein